MPEFSGFPSGTQNTPVPNVFFASLLPKIDDLAELKVVLHIFWSVYRKKEYPRFVTFDELASDRALMTGLGGDGTDALERGLKRAVDRRLLLDLALEGDDTLHRLYFVNTESDRQAVERIRGGEISIGAFSSVEPVSQKAPDDVFSLYENNIGVLTPLVADRIKEAETLYPRDWIAEAIGEAVSHNARSWSYVEAILRRWETRGKDSGEDRRHPGEDEDTEKYFRDRYGTPLRRRRS